MTAWINDTGENPFVRSYRHRPRLVSCWEHKSDWLDCHPPTQHSGKAVGFQRRPTRPHPNGLHYGSDAPASGPRSPLHPVCKIRGTVGSIWTHEWMKCCWKWTAVVLCSLFFPIYKARIMYTFFFNTEKRQMLCKYSKYCLFGCWIRSSITLLRNHVLV